MDNASVYDSALLGYFTEAVAPAISFAPYANLFWCTTIPELAGRELYLHDGLAALAALHMADLPSASGPSTYLKMAQQRFVSASAGFRTAVSSINAENVVSTFTFSIIVAILQIKGGVLAKELQSFDPLGGFLALRGASQITKASGPLLLESCIESLRRSTGPITFSTEDNANTLIPWLDTLALTADGYANQEALAYLRLWLNNLDTWPKAWFQLAWWPAKVSQEYIDRLQNKEPVSLIIFLYWCAGINSRYKNWFMAGYTRESLQFVQKHLGPDWNNLVEYPTSAIWNPTEATCSNGQPAV